MYSFRLWLRRTLCSLGLKGGKCAGCGAWVKDSELWESDYGYFVCEDCDPDDVADALVAHVIDPNGDEA